MITHLCPWCGADAAVDPGVKDGPAELACTACGIRVAFAPDPIDPPAAVSTAA